MNDHHDVTVTQIQSRVYLKVWLSVNVRQQGGFEVDSWSRICAAHSCALTYTDYFWAGNVC